MDARSARATATSRGARCATWTSGRWCGVGGGRISDGGARGSGWHDTPRDAEFGRWRLLVRIPIGTVWSEEAAFRAALGTVAAQSLGPRWGRVLQATAFGLSHVADARGAGDSVLGTVVATGVAGWAFGWLYDRTGSLASPMLAHLAINGAGAVAAVVVQRHGLMVSSPI